MLEFGVVVTVVALLVALLLQRLGEATHEAHRVQWRMAAEQLRLQGQLLHLRCGEDLPCRQQLLAQRRPAPGEPGLPEAPPPEGIDPLVLSVVQAAGLLQRRDESHAGWYLQPLTGARVQVALRAHPACRLIVERRGGQLLVSPPGPNAC